MPAPTAVPARRAKPALAADRRLQADAAAVHEALSDLVRVYQFRDRDRICCHDVSVTQCYALEVLIRHGALTLNRMAAELYLDKSTASRVVATLERKRYVARSPHATDRRSVSLAATPAGRRLYQKIRRGLLTEERRLLQDFEPGVRAAAAKIIARLARAAEARSGLGPLPAACGPTDRGGRPCSSR